MLLNFLNLQAAIDLEDKTRDYFSSSFPFSLGEVIPSTLYNPWLQHQCEPSYWQMGVVFQGNCFADMNPDFSKERAITRMCLSGVISEPSHREAAVLVQFFLIAHSRSLSNICFGIIETSG